MPRRNPTCGCTPCEVALDCHPVCRCIPQAICVTMSAPGGDCDCKPPDEYSPAASMQVDWDETSESYHGTLSCAGLEIDLEFTFERIDGENYFCLESECLGLVGAYKLCQELEQTSCENPVFDFTVDVGSCGDPYCGEATISTAKAERVERDPDCGGECQSCDCFCECLCVSYSDTKCYESVKVCWDKSAEHWQASLDCPEETVTVTLRFEENPYTGACELAIETSAASDLDPVEVTCPDIAASWSFKKDDGTDASISVACVKCGECPILLPCCTDYELPSRLYATVSTQCDDFSLCPEWACAAVVPLDFVGKEYCIDGFPYQEYEPSETALHWSGTTTWCDEETLKVDLWLCDHCCALGAVPQNSLILTAECIEPVSRGRNASGWGACDSPTECEPPLWIQFAAPFIQACCDEDAPNVEVSIDVTE